MKIYTRTGDRGQTALSGGTRVPKDSLRVEAYGTVDELNSVLGWALSELDGVSDSDSTGSKSGAFSMDQVRQWILQIQGDLFELGSDLATPPEKFVPAEARIAAGDVKQLEEWIDACDAEVPPLTRFVLPGGHRAAAALQVARSVCRRAERLAVGLSRQEPVGPEVVKYLNRLSDLLFVLARLVNIRAGTPEPEWMPRLRTPDPKPKQQQ